MRGPLVDLIEHAVFEKPRLRRFWETGTDPRRIMPSLNLASLQSPSWPRVDQSAARYCLGPQ